MGEGWLVDETGGERQTIWGESTGNDRIGAIERWCKCKMRNPLHLARSKKIESFGVIKPNAA